MTKDRKKSHDRSPKSGNSLYPQPDTARWTAGSQIRRLGHRPKSRSEFRGSPQRFFRDPRRGCHVNHRKAHGGRDHWLSQNACRASQAECAGVALHHRRTGGRTIRRWQAVIRATRPVHCRHRLIGCCLHRLNPGKDQDDPQGAKQDKLAQILQHFDSSALILCRSQDTKCGAARAAQAAAPHSRTAWRHPCQRSARQVRAPRRWSGRGSRTRPDITTPSSGPARPSPFSSRKSSAPSATAPCRRNSHCTGSCSARSPSTGREPPFQVADSGHQMTA